MVGKKNKTDFKDGFAFLNKYANKSGNFVSSLALDIYAGEFTISEIENILSSLIILSTLATELERRKPKITKT